MNRLHSFSCPSCPLVQYVMVSLTTDKQMMFGGTEEPCAYGELISSALCCYLLIREHQRVIFLTRVMCQLAYVCLWA